MTKKPETSVVSEIKEVLELLKSLNAGELVEQVKYHAEIIRDMKGMMFEIREALNAKMPPSE